MKKTIAILVTGLMTALLAGCTKPASDSNRAATAPTNTAAPANLATGENKNAGAATANPAPANPSGNANVSSGNSAPAVPDPTKLVGSYQLNQIQKQGVATMMSEVKTNLVFTADGRYSRAISAKGKTVQTESGRFRLEGETLTFVRLLSNKTINNPPVEKNYNIALSPDGRELRLTSKTGETAIFYRGN
jgi:hypothetical protein